MPRADLDIVEDFIRASNATTENVLEAVENLTASHADMRALIETMGDELAAVSTELAALRADRVNGSSDGKDGAATERPLPGVK